MVSLQESYNLQTW